MTNYYPELKPNCVYHVYNRAIGNEKLFLKAAHYHFFLKRYSEYINPIANTYCYCLMPNHFHFIVGIKGEEELLPLIKCQNKVLSKALSKKWSNLFNSYTKSLNSDTNRIGNLFCHIFKRKAVASEDYVKKLVHYIHFNPVISGLADTPQGWPYSSYKAILTEKQTSVKKGQVLEWFGNLENFIYCHQVEPALSGVEF